MDKRIFINFYLTCYILFRFFISFNYEKLHKFYVYSIISTTNTTTITTNYNTTTTATTTITITITITKFSHNPCHVVFKCIKDI